MADLDFIPIPEKIEVAYINAKGVRRVGQADGITADGDTFRVQHKGGYYEVVNSDQLTRAARAGGPDSRGPTPHFFTGA